MKILPRQINQPKETYYQSLAIVTFVKHDTNLLAEKSLSTSVLTGHNEKSKKLHERQKYAFLYFLINSTYQ